MLLFSKFGLSCVLLCFDSHQLNCNGSLDDQLKIDTLLSYCSSYLIFFHHECFCEVFVFEEIMGFDLFCSFVIFIVNSCIFALKRNKL